MEEIYAEVQGTFSSHYSLKGEGNMLTEKCSL